MTCQSAVHPIERLLGSGPGSPECQRPFGLVAEILRFDRFA